MTPDKTPSDTELDAILCNQWPAFSMQATLVKLWLRAAMRDSIAKWGSPVVATKVTIPTSTMEQEFQNHFRRGFEAGKKDGSPVVAREPVAWYEYNADLDAWFLAYSHNPKAKTRPLVFDDTTPQPTQAQAGAVPKYRMLEPGVDRIDAADEYLQDDAQTWEKDPGGVFVGSIYGGALRPARRVITSLIGITHKEGGQHAAD